MRRNASPLDVAQDRLADFLFKHPSRCGGLHPLNEGVGVAHSLGQHDDGVVTRFLVAPVEERDDAVHVVIVFGNHGDLRSAADRGGQGQIPGITSHHLD